MQVVVEDVSSIEKKLTIDVEAERVSAAITKVSKDLSKKISLPGFRAGKAPLSMLEKRFWADIEHSAVEEVVQKAVQDAIKEKELKAVGTKNLEPGKLVKGEGYHFVINIEVFPELSVEKYEGLNVKKPRVECNEEDLKKALDNIRNAHKSLVPVTDHNKLEAGDIVVGDLNISDNGKSVTDQFGIRIEVGTSKLLPNGDAILVGREVPSKLDEMVEYPADFDNKLLAGKTVRVEFDLKEIKKEELLELGDDLAAAAGFDNFDAMKEDTKKNILDKAAKEAEETLNENIGTALIEANKFDVPSTMVRDRAIAQVRQMLEQFAAYMPDLTKNLTDEMAENMIQRNLPGAERDVRLSLILGEVSKKEKVEVTADDVDAEIKRIAEGAGQSAEQIRAYFEKNKAMEGLKISLVKKKTMDLIISKAAIEEVDPASLKHEEEHNHEHGEDCDCCH